MCYPGALSRPTETSVGSSVCFSLQCLFFTLTEQKTRNATTYSARNVSQSSRSSVWSRTNVSSPLSDCLVGVDALGGVVEMSTEARTLPEHSRPRCVHRVHFCPGHFRFLGLHCIVRQGRSVITKHLNVSGLVHKHMNTHLFLILAAKRAFLITQIPPFVWRRCPWGNIAFHALCGLNKSVRIPGIHTLIIILAGRVESSHSLGGGASFYGSVNTTRQNEPPPLQQQPYLITTMSSSSFFLSTSVHFIPSSEHRHASRRDQG